MLQLIKIRWLQLQYELKNLGVVFSILLLGFLIALEFALFLGFTKYPIYLSVAILLVLFSQHLSRKDARFIKLHIENARQAVAIEYAFFALPFVMPILFTAHWYFFCIILMGIFAISYLEPRSSNQTSTMGFLSKIIPVRYFEALSFLRKHFMFIPFLLIYLTALSLCWVRGLPLFLLFIETTFALSFFNENEPLNMVRKDLDLNGKSFLLKKLKQYILPLIIAYSPILVLQSYFQPDLPLWCVAFLFVQILNVSAIIFYKYALYKPNAYFNLNNPVVILVGFCLFFPFLIPITLILNFQYFPKAIKNLNTYLQ